ncbi:hypothetical protein GA845_35080 [Burkholderia pseudomallei]|nr:hypothetical protein [Burkholderia pseudomallei]
MLNRFQHGDVPPERIGANKTTWAALRASCAPAGPATERLAAFRRRPGRIRAGAAHVDARGFVDRTIGNPIDIAGIAYGARSRRPAGLAKTPNVMRSASRRLACPLGRGFREHDADRAPDKAMRTGMIRRISGRL